MKNIALEIVSRSIRELHAEIDRHHALMANMMTENIETGQLEKQLTVRHSPCVTKLKASIIETIDVLEESRKAFKSKQLENLRKKLMRVLFETDPHHPTVINTTENERCKL